MRVTVNGKAMELPDGLSVERLLERLEVPRQYTAVALNGEVARKSSYAHMLLREADRVEIVRPMGGG